MLQVKTFEVRDSGTFIPCIGILMSPSDVVGQDRYLVRRAGYGDSPLCVLFGRMDGRDFAYDAYDRPVNPRTLHVAHEYVAMEWDHLATGAVVDVEFILGMTTACKTSEAVAEPL